MGWHEKSAPPHGNLRAIPESARHPSGRLLPAAGFAFPLCERRLKKLEGSMQMRTESMTIEEGRIY